MTTNWKLRAMLLGSGAALALVAGPAFAGQADDLKAQVEQLQSRLDQLDKQQSAAEAKTAAAPTDAVVGGDFPGSFKLPGSDTSVAIHGYTKFDFLIDPDQQNGDSFAFTGIRPNSSTAQKRGVQFRLHARQTRLNFQTRTPTNYGQLKTYVEGDFFGANGNQNISNSTSFRIRHAYGVLGPVLTGQTWSNFMDLEDLPETLDFNGPVGQTFARQAQIRYTQSLGKFTVSGSVENAQNDYTTNTGTSVTSTIGSSVTVPTAQDVVNLPDFTARVQYEDSWGRLSLSGVLRQFSLDNGAGRKTSTLGGGGQFGATFNLSTLSQAFGKDQVGVLGIYGSGLGRYIAAGGGLQQGAVVKNFGTAAERIETQMEVGGIVWVQHHWTEQLRSNAVFGIQHNHFSDAIPFATGNTDLVESAHVDLIWSPVKSVNIGLEFIYGNRDTQRNIATGSSQNGDSKRLQFSAQYFF